MSIKEKYNLSDQQAQNVVGAVSDVLGIEQEKVAISMAGVKSGIKNLSDKAVNRVGNMSDAEKAVFFPVAAGAASAAVSYGVPAAIEAVKGAKIRVNKNKYIKQMKKVHPELRNMPKEDLEIAYNSIAMHTPHILKDPLLGGQTLKQFAKFRMADVTQLNEISRLRGTRPLDQAMFNATEALSRGVREGISGYNVERIRLNDQRYREKIDEQRQLIDALRMDQAERSQGLAEERFRYQQDVLDPYQVDRDAMQDARDEVRLQQAQQGLDQQMWMFKEKLPYDTVSVSQVSTYDSKGKVTGSKTVTVPKTRNPNIRFSPEPSIDVKKGMDAYQIRKRLKVNETSSRKDKTTMPTTQLNRMSQYRTNAEKRKAARAKARDRLSEIIKQKK